MFFVLIWSVCVSFGNERKRRNVVFLTFFFFLDETHSSKWATSYLSLCVSRE